MEIKKILRRKFVKRKTLNDQMEVQKELIQIIKNSTNSKGEYFQDLWVLSNFARKREGYFVEFGATDGISASNTWLLETEYGWTGILAEPCKLNFIELEKNRKCLVDARAVWEVSGEMLLFSERRESYLSSIQNKSNQGEIVREYYVESVSLNDLLTQHKAPRIIDYISIDVEGAELVILKEFFTENLYKVNTFSIEHNWRKDKREIEELLLMNGYKVVYRALSFRDTFYVRIEI